MGLLAQYGYAYDPSGQITTWTQQQGGNPLKTILPEYDLAGQLTGTVETVGSVTNELSWTYDLAGNRTSSSFNGNPTTYTNNDLNQLIQVAPSKMEVAGTLNVSATVSVDGLTTTTQGPTTDSTSGPRLRTGRRC